MFFRKTKKEIKEVTDQAIITVGTFLEVGLETRDKVLDEITDIKTDFRPKLDLLNTNIQKACKLLAYVIGLLVISVAVLTIAVIIAL